MGVSLGPSQKQISCLSAAPGPYRACRHATGSDPLIRSLVAGLPKLHKVKWNHRVEFTWAWRSSHHMAVPGFSACGGIYT
jgi:hypothetical protein